MSSKMHIINEIDRGQFHKKITDYYGSNDHDVISTLIKHDLKDLYKMQALMNYVGFDDEEFFAHAAILYSEIFNKMTIKRIRLNLELRDHELNS